MGCKKCPICLLHPQRNKAISLVQLYLKGIPRQLSLLGDKMSQPISRVLSWAIIHLGCLSLDTSSNLPGSEAGHPNGSLFGLAPDGVYHATKCYHLRGALLPHHFTLTLIAQGGLFSAALSVGSRPPGVTWRLTLWSPDFPL